MIDRDDIRALIDNEVALGNPNARADVLAVLTELEAEEADAQVRSDNLDAKWRSIDPGPQLDPVVYVAELEVSRRFASEIQPHDWLGPGHIDDYLEPITMTWGSGGDSAVFERVAKRRERARKLTKARAAWSYRERRARDREIERREAKRRARNLYPEFFNRKEAA